MNKNESPIQMRANLWEALSNKHLSLNTDKLIIKRISSITEESREEMAAILTEKIKTLTEEELISYLKSH